MSLAGLQKLEASLWEAADQLRTNSTYTADEYCMPVMGVIFLRHATNRYNAAAAAIKADQDAGRMQRPVVKDDYLKRRALMLPEVARYDYIMALPKEKDRGEALIAAMDAIEEAFPKLQGLLPKEYDRFEKTVLEDLLRIFDRDELRMASGDIFGRIYEYFLKQFSVQGAIDNGEFFTPPSLVQTIVNVIEPDHGVVFDPACGSGGMFVQTSHFIERLGQDTTHLVTFYGQESKATTIRLAKMNLAVHGLEGDIREANTFYEDVHNLFERCNFVMANPPFNMDKVDAEKVKLDRRLPFGLPGVNKAKKVSNGNFLWISYFHSYLAPGGRAGFVMSSQASSAGNDEAKVRQKIIQTGDVDVMIAIRSNFFYTRTVPCELWHFDRGKPEDRREQVLMIDARQVFRKVTRKIYDFTPEQSANISSIVWLYRGQNQRFLDLLRGYFGQVCAEVSQAAAAVKPFDDKLSALRDVLDEFAKAVSQLHSFTKERMQPIMDVLGEITEAKKAYIADCTLLLADLTAFTGKHVNHMPATNETQHAARKELDPLAERIRSLVKQVDLLYKLCARAVQLAGELADDKAAAECIDKRAANRSVKDLDEERRKAVEQLKAITYFHRQIAWLQDRFPKAEMRAVPGLCKVVTKAEIEHADWSLSPGRYVGIAPPDVDEDFDFEQAIRDIHIELADLNIEAAELAKKIQKNFEELGA